MAISLDLEADFDDYFFPIGLPQVRDLVGKMLTHIEAMGLPERAEKANKDLIKQSLYRWFHDAQENSITSYRGCIAPIQRLRDGDRKERKYVWLADGDYAISVNQSPKGKVIDPTPAGSVPTFLPPNQ